MFKCNYCNKEFPNKSALSNHERHWCESNTNKLAVNSYVNHKKVACKKCGKLIDVACIQRHELACGRENVDKSRHLDHDDLFCKYCGKECKNRNSLAQHEIRCRENPERKDFNNLADFSIQYIKGQTKETSDVVKKFSKTLRLHYKDGSITSALLGKPGAWLGRHHTEESKEKIRQSTLDYLAATIDSFHPRYNINACRYIDELNKQKGWHLQHAENGGEVGIGGYFVDGYDKDLNIAFEYDEPRHYKDVKNNILTDKDFERMTFIKNKLHCKFFRYNEKLDLLYECVLK